MNDRASIYVPITSITKADGGRTRIVTGVAASDRLDYDGQRASYDWFKKELDAWFKVGNMRQDHAPGGVGKAISLEFDDAKHTATVTSKAVDSDTILKLDEGVLNGYSWGAKSVPGNPIRIRKDAGGVEWVEQGKIVEVSYVDHPANPDCFVSLVKSAGKQGLKRSKVLGDLADGDVHIQGGVDFDAILKAILADVAKRDVSAAERERLGDRGHAVDTGQEHPSYPIANRTDLENAIRAYGRANPADRAKVRAHLISEAKRLGATDLIPDGWKSVDAVLAKAGDGYVMRDGKRVYDPDGDGDDDSSAEGDTDHDYVLPNGKPGPKARASKAAGSMAGCNCCDDCGPDCQGDCCQECRMMSKAASGPAGILAGVRALADKEPDQEYKGFLGKLAGAVEGWARLEGVTVDLPTYARLATLSKAATEPDLTKRRTFYSQANRSNVEQAMQNLHQALGLFMEGGASFDADKDQRDGTLTGQDAPQDTEGAPGSAPGDGVPDDGNMNLDPDMVRDGDPAIRTPDGERDGRAQGEAGTHTFPTVARADQPGEPGPRDGLGGAAPRGKGKPPFDGQQSPSKAAKRLRKLEGQITELRKAAGAQPNGQPAIALQQTLGGGKAKRRKGGTDKALRAELAKTNAALQELASRPLSDPSRPLDMQAAMQAIVRKHERRVRKLMKRQKPAPAPDPLAEKIDALTKAVTAAAARPAADGAPQTIDSSLLLADLTRAAYEQTRKDLTTTTERLARQVKRVERKLRKETAAQIAAGNRPIKEGIDALGRMPRPGGPQLVRPTDKTFPVNDTIERQVSPELARELAQWTELTKSTDQVLASAATQKVRQLIQQHGLTG